VTIPKPGNVHRGADFEDVTFADFLASAVAIAPALESASQNRVGHTIVTAVRATQRAVSTNTNLGTILLLAPLATVPIGTPIKAGLPDVLRDLGPQDAESVYQAIRESGAGGLGAAESLDVSADAPGDLLAAMRAAADRDLVARQYTNQFQQVFECACPWIIDGINNGWNLAEAVIQTHVRLMGEFPDSLIHRKCGSQIADESAARASRVLDAGDPRSENYQSALSDFDFWLRADGHRRNPGTSADMIAAGLFVLLRDGQLETAPMPRVF
jgi:triphosphoribosyl-dephospho-CoA synthase